MTWKEEFRLYWGGQLPTDGAQLEYMLDELGISAFNIGVTKHGSTGVDTYEAQKRIREALRDRWGARIAIVGAGGALISILGAIFSWLAFFAK